MIPGGNTVPGIGVTRCVECDRRVFTNKPDDVDRCVGCRE